MKCNRGSCDHSIDDHNEVHDTPGCPGGVDACICPYGPVLTDCNCCDCDEYVSLFY